MLVFSRQIGERLTIDGNIEVTVVEIRPDRVRLGINAPSEVAIHHEDICRHIVTSTIAAQQDVGESQFLPEFA